MRPLEEALDSVQLRLEVDLALLRVRRRAAVSDSARPEVLVLLPVPRQPVPQAVALVSVQEALEAQRPLVSKARLLEVSERGPLERRDSAPSPPAEVSVRPQALLQVVSARDLVDLDRLLHSRNQYFSNKAQLVDSARRPQAEVSVEAQAPSATTRFASPLAYRETAPLEWEVALAQDQRVDSAHKEQVCTDNNRAQAAHQLEALALAHTEEQWDMVPYVQFYS